MSIPQIRLGNSPLTSPLWGFSCPGLGTHIGSAFSIVDNSDMASPHYIWFYFYDIFHKPHNSSSRPCSVWFSQIPHWTLLNFDVVPLHLLNVVFVTWRSKFIGKGSRTSYPRLIRVDPKSHETQQATSLTQELGNFRQYIYIFHPTESSLLLRYESSGKYIIPYL